MTETPLILAFDTAAAHCAVALLSATDVLASKSETMSRGQAERLFPMINEVLQIAKRPLEDVTYIGVGVGPGNFTGIRLAVSAARGLALAKSIPAIGVSGFEIAAYDLSEDAIVTIKGPRNSVYAQKFSNSIASTDPEILDLDMLPTDTRQLCLEDLATEERAIRIARIALRRSLLSVDPIESPAPLYLRAADAAPPKDPAPVILPG